MRNFLELSTDLINSESSQKEFSSAPTKGHFFSRKKSVEETIEKLNKIGTNFYINKSYFLYNKSSFIEQTFITTLNKKIYGSISYFNKKTKNDIIKIIDLEEFLKFYVKKDTLKDFLSLQLVKAETYHSLEKVKFITFHCQEYVKKEKEKCQSRLTVLLFTHNKILTLMEG